MTAASLPAPGRPSIGRGRGGQPGRSRPHPGHQVREGTVGAETAIPEETQVSKSHPEQWTVREVAERPEKSLVTALREFATTQIADCGGPVAVLGPPLRHLAGGPQLCGPAVTVWTKPGDILYVLKATDLIADGDVLVVDGGGRLDAAVIGDIAGQALADLGCDGLVVDGAVRDLDGLDATGLATFAAGAHPATGSNQGPGAINVVVQCGGVTVRPGDVVRGDASGLVVVPKEHLAAVLTMTKAVDDQETGWRQAIARGASLPTAAGIDDLISKLAADRGAVLACRGRPVGRGAGS
jgi:4-hydroxy-4-methyl-2-oxoglutarate aldolase